MIKPDLAVADHRALVSDEQLVGALVKDGATNFWGEDSRKVCLDGARIWVDSAAAPIIHPQRKIDQRDDRSWIVAPDSALQLREEGSVALIRRGESALVALGAALGGRAGRRGNARARDEDVLRLRLRRDFVACDPRHSCGRRRRWRSRGFGELYGIGGCLDGRRRSNPGGFGNMGRGFGCANPSPSSRFRNTPAWRRAMSASVSPSAGV